MEFKSHWGEGNKCKITPKQNEQKMSRRDLFCAQTFAVLLFCLGFVAGILIGIYVYHGGPDAEVTCKNMPDNMSNMEGQPKQTTTKQTTVSTPTDASTESPAEECRNCRRNFTYSINNQIEEPLFNESITLDIERNKPLIFYMGKAADTEPGNFTRFKATYFPNLGFFIDSINKQAGNFADNQTYWQILNSTGPLSVGVSSYVPSHGDEVLFNFTVYTNNTNHW